MQKNRNGRKERIDVVILAGGFGKRLKGLTKKIPKPMLTVGTGPFLDILITYMRSFGFRRFILCTGYKSEVIKNYYKKKNFRCDIIISDEKSPLGTGGAVKQARRFIKSNPFFILNGDSFCRFNPMSLLRFHKRKKAFISMAVTKMACRKEYGTVKLDSHLRLASFYEKGNHPAKNLVNAGVYVFNKEAFALMPHRKRFSLEKDFFPDIDKAIFGYPCNKFFIDIGTPEKYRKVRATPKMGLS